MRTRWGVVSPSPARAATPLASAHHVVHGAFLTGAGSGLAYPFCGRRGQIAPPRIFVDDLGPEGLGPCVSGHEYGLPDLYVVRGLEMT